MRSNKFLTLALVEMYQGGGCLLLALVKGLKNLATIETPYLYIKHFTPTPFHLLFVSLFRSFVLEGREREARMKELC